MSSFRENALRTDEWTNGQTRLLRSQRPVGRETKNQIIPMNQSEEKSEKPHFLPFVRGLDGIKNFPKNMEIANLYVLPRLTLLPKIREY